MVKDKKITYVISLPKSLNNIQVNMVNCLIKCHNYSYKKVRRGMFVPTFGLEEKRIRSLLSVGQTFLFNTEVFRILYVGKPTCSKGEPKTDIYVFAKNQAEETIELKISFKKENADFLENKTNFERAEQLFGNQWSEIIMNSTTEIRDNFFARPLIYKQKYRRTEAGAITLGWKFELLNKPVFVN